MFKKRRLGRKRFRRISRRRRGAFRLKKFVKGIVKRMSEIKYSIIANQYANTVGSSSPVTVSVTPVFVQGTEKDQRIGDKIQYKYFQFRLMMDMYANTDPDEVYSAFTVRAILWVPRATPTTGAPVDLTYLFDTQPDYPAPDYNVVSSINNKTARVMMDRSYTMTPTPYSNRTQLPSMRIIKFKVPIRNNVTFRGSADTQPSQPIDQVYLTVVTSASAASNQPTLRITYVSRISFIDI